MADILGLISGFRELVTMIETRAIAETTAANTRVEDLITALENMVLTGGTVTVEAPNVTVYPQITVNCSCAGGGTSQPQEAGEEGGTPPAGTSAPDEIDNRKCKAANILVQDLIAYTNNMSSLGLFNWGLDYSTLGSILNSASAGLTNGLLGISAQVGGFLSNIQNLIFSGTFAADIPTVLSANQDAMVCALYNASNVVDAKSEVLAASGLTGFDANWVETILTTNALNMLFFASGNSESIIWNYAGNADCSGCGGDVGGYGVVWGVQNLPNMQSISSVNHPNLSTQYVSISIDVPGRTVYSIDVLSGEVNRPAYNELQVYRSEEPTYVDKEFTAFSETTLVTGMEFNSDSAFTIRVNWDMPT